MADAVSVPLPLAITGIGGSNVQYLGAAFTSHPYQSAGFSNNTNYRASISCPSGTPLFAYVQWYNTDYYGYGLTAIGSSLSQENATGCIIHNASTGSVYNTGIISLTTLQITSTNGRSDVSSRTYYTVMYYGTT